MRLPVHVRIAWICLVIGVVLMIPGLFPPLAYWLVSGSVLVGAAIISLALYYQRSDRP